MSYSKIGNCPRCGAGIFTPEHWNGVAPPPSTFTCSCIKPGVYTPNEKSRESSPPNPAVHLAQNIEMRDVVVAIEKLINQQAKIETLLLELLGKNKKTTSHD